MTSTTARTLATRHACIYGISPRCVRGTGKPRTKKCGACGGALAVETGLYGVFVWRGDGRYLIADAVKTFTVEARAEAFSRTDTRYVVRWVPIEAPSEPVVEQAPAVCNAEAAVVKIDGAGSGVCAACAGKLDFSWLVTFSDGVRETRCSVHLPEAPVSAPASADLVAEATPAEAPSTAPAQHTTREAWLVDAVEALRPLFAAIGEQVPAVRVSVGWPGGRGKKQTVIGQCWASWTAADKVAQVFVSPVLDDAVQVLETLVHELVHAVDDCKNGHKAGFARIAKAVGLTGKMTATVAGDALKERLAGIAEELGAYPHAKLAAPTHDGAGEKKQTTRMIKVECGDCGYTARTTRKWLEEVGAPICPCNKEEMSVA